eukprot:TRINITY_DN63801_c0_g1_i1.p1 TRINITY_DN63801_c0_g1~~TRINITY_DN63801_c0_g1_i1.p1  ORF type:complete len:203 (-),score=32.35 TRINITY_DN63801_c0_g1_i1:24-545(-)
MALRTVQAATLWVLLACLVTDAIPESHNQDKQFIRREAAHGGALSPSDGPASLVQVQSNGETSVNQRQVSQHHSSGDPCDTVMNDMSFDTSSLPSHACQVLDAADEVACKTRCGVDNICSAFNWQQTEANGGTCCFFFRGSETPAQPKQGDNVTTIFWRAGKCKWAVVPDANL